jgi:putative ABC transport system permease protein
MMGNVKAFILGICGAVVFATLLVSGNTMAMSIRERTREVAVLKTLGFTRRTVLGLFVGEAIALSAVGGLIGSLIGYLAIAGFRHSGQAAGFFPVTPVSPGLVLLSVAIAGLVGFMSAVIPSYHASQVNIVDGLRHIG